jgi:FkbM family methyltransferase
MHDSQPRNGGDAPMSELTADASAFPASHPIAPSEAAQWRPWAKGPPESRLAPASRWLRATLWLARRFRFHGRGALMRLVARSFGGSEVVLHTRWGATLVSPPDDTYFLHGVCSEPLETAVITRLVRPGMTVLDIGANRGWYTVLLSKLVGPAGVVHAFEPDRTVLHQLRRNLERNAFCSNVEMHPQAASSSTGVAHFWAQADTLVSRLAEGHGAEPAGDATRYEVETIRLHDFLVGGSIERLDFIKCDVEGAEIQVLEGLLPALERGQRPALLLEYIEDNLRQYGGRLDDIPRRLNPGGRRRYRCLGLCGEHGRPEPLDGPVCPQALNLLCLPEETADKTLSGLFEDR